MPGHPLDAMGLIGIDSVGAPSVQPRQEQSAQVAADEQRIEL